MVFIGLTKLVNGDCDKENLITVNVDSICTIANDLICTIPGRKIRETGYTTMSLINGHTITVKETVAEIEEAISGAGGLVY